MSEVVGSYDIFVYTCVAVNISKYLPHDNCSAGAMAGQQPGQQPLASMRSRLVLQRLHLRGGDQVGGYGGWWVWGVRGKGAVGGGAKGRGAAGGGGYTGWRVSCVRGGGECTVGLREPKLLS